MDQLATTPVSKPIFIWLLQAALLAHAVLFALRAIRFASENTILAGAAAATAVFLLVALGIAQLRRSWARWVALVGLAFAFGGPLALEVVRIYVVRSSTEPLAEPSPLISGLLILLAVPFLFGDYVKPYYHRGRT